MSKKSLLMKRFANGFYKTDSGDGSVEFQSNMMGLDKLVINGKSEKAFDGAEVVGVGEKTENLLDFSKLGNANSTIETIDYTKQEIIVTRNVGYISLFFPNEWILNIPTGKVLYISAKFSNGQPDVGGTMWRMYADQNTSKTVLFSRGSSALQTRYCVITDEVKSQFTEGKISAFAIYMKNTDLPTVSELMLFLKDSTTEANIPYEPYGYKVSSSLCNAHLNPSEWVNGQFSGGFIPSTNKSFITQVKPLGVKATINAWYGVGTEIITKEQLENLSDITFWCNQPSNNTYQVHLTAYDDNGVYKSTLCLSDMSWAYNQNNVLEANRLYHIKNIENMYLYSTYKNYNIFRLSLLARQKLTDIEFEFNLIDSRKPLLPLTAYIGNEPLSDSETVTVDFKNRVANRKGANLLSTKGRSEYLLNKNGFSVFGLTFKCNDDLSLTINGTYTNNSTYVIALCNDNGLVGASGVRYRLSGCVGGSTTTYWFQTQNGYRDAGNGVTIAETVDLNLIRLYIAPNATFDNITLKPMLNLGTTALQYVPYGKNDDLTNINQTLLNAPRTTYPETNIITDTSDTSLSLDDLLLEDGSKLLKEDSLNIYAGLSVDHRSNYL